MIPLERRPVFAALVLLFTVLGTLGVRVLLEARAELASAEEFRARGNDRAASDHYRRALRWSFPVSPYETKASAALESIAREREGAGDPDGALLAWRSLLGGIASARHLYSRRDHTEERARDEIARLMGSRGAPASDAGSESSDLVSEHRKLLEREIVPDPLWATFLLLGFATWVVSLLWLIRRGFDSSGRPSWPGARAPLVGAVAGFASFVLGLLFA